MKNINITRIINAILIILAGITIVIGCVKCNAIASKDTDYNVITIDSCEYICSKYNTIGIIHKQNCKFCEKRDKQKTEELIKKLKEM